MSRRSLFSEVLQDFHSSIDNRLEKVFSSGTLTTVDTHLVRPLTYIGHLGIFKAVKNSLRSATHLHRASATWGFSKL